MITAEALLRWTLESSNTASMVPTAPRRHEMVFRMLDLGPERVGPRRLQTV